MNRLIRFVLLVPILGLLALSDLTAQVYFANEDIGASISQYGTIKVYSPAGPLAADTVEQINRITMLVGINDTAVFCYNGDQDAVSGSEQVVVASPALSDHELTGLFDNGYSGAPPDVEIKYNIYGWSTGGYLLIKYTVTNTSTEAYNARLGLDLMPKPAEDWNDHILGLDATNGIIYALSGDTAAVGIKMLSQDMVSLKLMDYDRDYAYTDPSIWALMSHDIIDTRHESDYSDGTIVITSTAPIAIAVDASVEVFVAVSVGTDSTEMADNMLLAQTAATAWLAVDDRPTTRPAGFRLAQNYPNPFNPTTTIRFDLPQEQRVYLMIYDIMGREVVRLVDEVRPAGYHEMRWSGRDVGGRQVASGIYFARLVTPQYSKVNKMLLLK